MPDPVPSPAASTGPKDEAVPLQLDGEVLSGRLVVYADTLALGLIEMADKFDAMDPVILMAAGKTPGAVLREVGAQLAQSALQYGGSSDA